MKILAFTGRGGTGKTSFAALTTKYFIEKKEYPLLLVDADPDQNLAEMVGVDLVEKGKETISDLLVETFLEKGGTTVGVAPSERIEGRIWERSLYEGKYFDLMAVGPKWVEGCYCLPDAALKSALGRLTKAYTYVLVDSPGGLEHLNRKIASEVSDIFDVIDPSNKSFEHVRRAYRIVKEVGISFDNFYVVAGYRFPSSLENEIEAKTGLRYLGKIAQDREVEENVLAGKSLLDVSPGSKAYASIMEILRKAGY